MARIPGVHNYRFRAYGYTGFGSTNTNVLRVTTVLYNTGFGITYAASATLGDSFTCTIAGLYDVSASIRASDNFTNAGVGISVNATDFSSAPTVMPEAELIANSADRYNTQNTDPKLASVSAQVYLNVGDIVRVHGNGTGRTYDRLQISISKTA